MLTSILKSSYETGDIPAILKLAHITPIHKGGSQSEPANFRPISLSSHVIRTFERVMWRSLVNFLETNKKDGSRPTWVKIRKAKTLSTPHATRYCSKGFRGGRKSWHHLSWFYKSLWQMWSWHLINKIKRIGIGGRTGRLIFSFLTGRIQKVIVKGRKSQGPVLKSGVPQGSVLGPIRFLVYISDIGKDLTASTLVYVEYTKLKQRIKIPHTGDIKSLDRCGSYNFGKVAWFIKKKYIYI